MVLHLADAFAHHLQPIIRDKTLAQIELQYLKEIHLYDRAKDWYAECKKMYEEGAIQ